MKTLKEVYERHAEGLKTLYAELEKNNLYYACSFPLLLSTWEDEPMPKVMFFGQETNGWDWDPVPERPNNEGEIDYLMSLYNWFNLGKGPKSYNTLIWQYFRLLAEKLSLDSEHAFLWNNINKIGKAHEKGHPDPKAIELENKYFNVLADELEAIKPAVCVFFTGPNYDEDIRSKLPDVEFIPIEGYETRQFARLKSKHLPDNSFRTYHPGYGNLKYDWYQGVMDKIAELSK